jgi:hypothetical protein
MGGYQQSVISNERDFLAERNGAIKLGAVPTKMGCQADAALLKLATACASSS